MTFPFGEYLTVTSPEADLFWNAVLEMECFLIPQCRALSKRLALAEKSKETLTEEMKVASQNISRLQVSAACRLHRLRVFYGEFEAGRAVAADTTRAPPSTLFLSWSIILTMSDQRNCFSVLIIILSSFIASVCLNNTYSPTSAAAFSCEYSSLWAVGFSVPYAVLSLSHLLKLTKLEGGAAQYLRPRRLV